jgi:hypothetical protein
MIFFKIRRQKGAMNSMKQKSLGFCQIDVQEFHLRKDVQIVFFKLLILGCTGLMKSHPNEILRVHYANLLHCHTGVQFPASIGPNESICTVM